MAENPLEVDWSWYNSLIVLSGFVPFLVLIYLGPPPNLKPTEKGLRIAHLWGVVAGALGFGIWIYAISNYTRENQVPLQDESG
jgi:drug/metabolite transporter (DMT)-like permease